MSDPITIGRIGSIGVRSIRRTTRRNVKKVDIVGDYGSAFSLGVPAESYSLELQLTTQAQYHQLQEMVQNPLLDWDYITFPTMRPSYSGFYLIEENNSQEEPWHVNYFPFSVTITKLGSLGNLRLATQWYANGAETYSWGGATLATTRMVALPNGATNPAWAVAATRTTSDGTVKILENPTNQSILYNASATISDWYLSECKVWDTVTAGNVSENTWTRVYSKLHKFDGDKVVQNGLLRVIVGASVSTWYVYESVSTNSWKSIGTLLTALTGNLNATTTQFEIQWVDTEQIIWREIRMNGANRITLSYLLRRGANHCRITLTTFALGIDTGTYVALSKAGGFTQLYNATNNGAAGAGNLAVSATDSYEAGYNTSDNVVAGFTLLTQPGSQPLDPGAAGNTFPNSLIWATATARTFSLMGWAQDTSVLGNLVPNPGFETAGAGGADVWATWTESAGDGAIADEASIVHSGSHSAKLTAGASFNTTIAKNIAVQGSTTYEYTFWARGDGTNSGWRYVYDNTNASFLIANAVIGVTAATWTLVTLSFTTAANTASIAIVFACPAALGGITYIDDVHLAVLATARANAASIAAHSRYYALQRLILPDVGFCP